jgi:cell division protein FtsB
MKENTQHSKRKGILRSYPMVFIVVFLLFSFLLIRGGVEAYAKQDTILEKRNRLEGEHEKLTDYQASLEGRIGDIDSDYGLEKFIRETYGLVKPGETVIYVVSDLPEFKKDSVDNEKKKGLFKRLLE